jgi:hypothetical protein
MLGSPREHDVVALGQVGHGDSLLGVAVMVLVELQPTVTSGTPLLTEVGGGRMSG